MNVIKVKRKNEQVQVKEERKNRKISSFIAEQAKKKSQNNMFMQTIQFVRIIVIYTVLYIHSGS